MVNRGGGYGLEVPCINFIDSMDLAKAYTDRTRAIVVNIKRIVLKKNINSPFRG